MMGTSGGSNAEIGVLALVAFLADKESCLARLTELRAATDAATAQQEAAKQMQAVAEAQVKDAQAMQTTIDAAIKKSVETQVAQQAEGVRLQNMGIELSNRELEVRNVEIRQAAQDAAVKAARVELSAVADAVEKDRAFVAAQKAEYDEKLAKLRTITGG